VFGPLQADLVADKKQLGDASAEPVDIQDEVLAKPNAARDLANKALAALTIQDSSAMLGLLRKKESQFVSLDCCWQIEAQFFTCMAGDMGGRRLEQKVEQMLPVPGSKREISSVLQALHGLQASALFRFCSLSAQGAVNNVVEMLASMVQGRPPKLPSHPTAFILSVRSRLPNFCRIKGKDDKMLWGKDALLQHIANIQNTPESERSLELFEMPTVFAWMLTRQELVQVKEWREAVIAAQTASSGSGAGKSIAASASSSSSGKKPGEGEQALKDAMIMFG
jgi:hypothetical protein